MVVVVPLCRPQLPHPQEEHDDDDVRGAPRYGAVPERAESESEVLTADPLLIVLLRVLLTEHCSGSDRIRRRGGSAGAMRTVR